MTEHVDISKLYFQNVGGLTGKYLPSAEDETVGTLITSHGLFPVHLNLSIQNFFETFPWAKKKPFQYLCWLKPLNTEPYYTFRLTKAVKYYPDWLKESGWFKLQGVIESVAGKQIVIRTQQNYRPNRTEEEVEQSITHVTIYNCPQTIRKGQFWQIQVKLEDGQLNHLTSYRIADARQTKKLLPLKKEMDLKKKKLLKAS